eukprot:SAG31_NODE_2113_length_6422_cov_2.860035_2_plen_81_part_00
MAQKKDKLLLPQEDQNKYLMDFTLQRSGNAANWGMPSRSIAETVPFSNEESTEKDAANNLKYSFDTAVDHKSIVKDSKFP